MGKGTAGLVFQGWLCGVAQCARNAPGTPADFLIINQKAWVCFSQLPSVSSGPGATLGSISWGVLHAARRGFENGIA